ncbi:hypothetical protein [Streptomyces sp. Ag109_O5-1]|uniref:hypothetical protein n=1 Tax=Streptomyces sp. Ag109_O5-1 TaxID=1938851 RepID=UPI0016289B20|nr:hypothetical protein [Streptomyces sp. Ag109_O5-1]
MRSRCRQSGRCRGGVRPGDLQVRLRLLQAVRVQGGEQVTAVDEPGPPPGRITWGR